MKITKKPIATASTSFILDSLAKEIGHTQQIRELVTNGIEACLRRQATGNNEQGVVTLDVDWRYRAEGMDKLCVTDNGDGMSQDDLREFFGKVAVQGASKSRGLKQNFGVGAKVATLPRNPAGVVVDSWVDGNGVMLKIYRDGNGEYGLDEFEVNGEPQHVVDVDPADKPRIIKQSGTRVTLLGESISDNTRIRKNSEGGVNWVNSYLNARYFRLPGTVTVKVRGWAKDSSKCPKREPLPSDKKYADTFRYETVYGTKHLLDKRSSQRGVLQLSNAKVHWWFFKDGPEASKDLSSRGLRTNCVGVVFQDEVYYLTMDQQEARRFMLRLGIVMGGEYVAIYVEPDEALLGVEADIARTKLLLANQPIDRSEIWAQFGEEFKAQMPAVIRKKVEEMLSNTEATDASAKKRNLDRLKRIEAMLWPPVYRRNSTGEWVIGTPVLGNTRKTGKVKGPGPGGCTGTENRVNSTGTDENHVRSGRSGTKAQGTPVEPYNGLKFNWASKASGGTPPPESLEDLAAEVNNDCVIINADFRGFQQLQAEVNKAANPDGDPARLSRCIAMVREYVELQLAEVIISVRNLYNRSTWDKVRIAEALTPVGLTVAVMHRFHVREQSVAQLNRQLGVA